MTKILSLQNDKLCLRNVELDSREVLRSIGDFESAILFTDGTLSVIVDGESVIHKNVVPSGEIPYRCKELVYFVLETQIVVISRNKLVNSVRLETSIPAVRFALEALGHNSIISEVKEHQDTVVCEMQTHSINIGVSPRSAKKFINILANVKNSTNKILLGLPLKFVD